MGAVTSFSKGFSSFLEVALLSGNEAAFVFGVCVQAGSTLLKDFSDELPDLDERFLNGRINNKENRPFLERETIVKRVLAELTRTQSRKVDKPRLVALWSPRGTGKTSLVRHLAQLDQYAESRRCGRLLVIDASMLPQHAQNDVDTLVSAIIIWHLLQIFDGYAVEVGQGNSVAFKRLDIGPVLRLLEQTPSTPPPDGGVGWWIASFCNSKDDVLDQWLVLTEKAFAAKNSCPRLVFLDQSELLARLETGKREQKSGGARKSLLTEIFSKLPTQMACFCTGTLDLMRDAPAEKYTLLYVHSVPALAPLSRDAAAATMQQWNKTIYDDPTFNQIMLFSCGVPRLLQWAFQADGELTKASTEIALNEMSMCFAESYKSAAPLFSDDIETALAIVLCSAVRWTATGSRQFDRVPGTNTPWSDIFHAGAAFPAEKSVLVPRIWWCRDAAVSAKLESHLEGWNIDLKSLLPDPLKMVKSSVRGPLARGVPWEQMVANSLVARFRLYCLQGNSEADSTWVPFLEIYPTKNEHVQKVLEPFHVCWSQGVELSQTEATVSDVVGKAIRSNLRHKNAHHDLLIPVKRVSGGKLEYIAAQCRIGEMKAASGLKNQDKPRKPRRNENLQQMTNVLLQICPDAEGAQRFQKGTSWAKRQEDGKYSLMSCRSIIAQLDVLLAL